MGMIRNLTFLTLFISIAVLQWGCTKAFNPPVNASQKILVVDGLITKTAEKYSVNLSYANPYNSTIAQPVSKALVTISDDQGNTFNMVEDPNNAGSYFTIPTEFMGIIGRTYSLHITTSDGTMYQSGKQLMQQSFPIDSIYGVVINKQYLQTEGFEYIKVVNSYVNINSPAGSATNFRFIDSMLFECVWDYTGKLSAPTLFYGIK